MKIGAHEGEALASTEVGPGMPAPAAGMAPRLLLTELAKAGFTVMLVKKLYDTPGPGRGGTSRSARVVLHHRRRAPLARLGDDGVERGVARALAAERAGRSRRDQLAVAVQLELGRDAAHPVTAMWSVKKWLKVRPSVLAFELEMPLPGALKVLGRPSG